MFRTMLRATFSGVAVTLGVLCVSASRAQEVPAAQPAPAAPQAKPVNEAASTTTPAVTTPAVTPAEAQTNAPVSVVAPAVSAEEPLVTPEESSCFWGCWRVGTRYSHFKLKDKTRGEPFNGSFVGSITQISEEQDNTPNKLYLQYRLPKLPLWVGISYDHVRAKTMDDGDGDGIVDNLGGDGSVDLPGYVPYVQAAWDNSTRCTPYVQAGYAFYQAEFKPNANWSDGGRRRMNLGDTTGVELAGGLAVRLYKTWFADVFAQMVNVKDVTGDFTLNGEKQSDIVFTMSYTAYGAGVGCTF